MGQIWDKITWQRRKKAERSAKQLGYIFLPLQERRRGNIFDFATKSGGCCLACNTLTTSMQSTATR